MSTKLGEGIVASLQFARQLPNSRNVGVLRREPVKMTAEDEAVLDADEREQLLHSRAHDEAWTLDLFDAERREFESVVVSRSFADAIADAIRHSKSHLKPGQEPGSTFDDSDHHHTHSVRRNEVFVKIGRFALVPSVSSHSTVSWDAAVKPNGTLVTPYVCDPDAPPDPVVSTAIKIKKSRRRLDPDLRASRSNPERLSGSTGTTPRRLRADRLSSGLTPLLAPHFEDRLSAMSHGSMDTDDEDSAELDALGVGGLGDEQFAVNSLVETILDDDAELVDAMPNHGDGSDLPGRSPSQEENYVQHKKVRVPTRGVPDEDRDPDGGVDGGRSMLSHTLIMRKDNKSVTADYTQLAMLHHSDSHGTVMRKRPKSEASASSSGDARGNTATIPEEAGEEEPPTLVYGAKWDCTSHNSRRHRHSKQHAVPISADFFDRVVQHATRSKSDHRRSPNFSVEVRIVRQQEPEISKWSRYLAWAMLFVCLLAVGTGGAVFLALPSRIQENQPILASFWRNVLALICLLPLGSYEYMFNIKPIDRWGFKKWRTWLLVVTLGALVSVWSGSFVVALKYTTLERIYVIDNFYPLLILAWRRWIGAGRRRLGLSRGVHRYSTAFKSGWNRACLGATYFQWVGSGLAILGILLTIYSGNITKFVVFSSSDQLKGDLIAIIGALAGSIYILLGGKLRSLVPIYVMVVPVIFFSCIFLAAYTLIFEGSKFSDLWVGDADILEIEALLWLAFVTGVVGVITATYAHDHIAPFTNSAVLFLAPAIGGLTTLVLQTAETSWITWIGVFTIVVSSILIASGFGGFKKIPWVEDRIVRTRWCPDHALVTFCIDDSVVGSPELEDLKSDISYAGVSRDHALGDLV